MQCVRVQEYNSGTAPFPYSTGCTATITSGTCDPANLVAEMDFSSQAEPVALDFVQSNDDSDAVELVRRATCSRNSSELLGTPRRRYNLERRPSFSVHGNKSSLSVVLSIFSTLILKAL